MNITHALVTRPEPQASELAALLRERGVTPILAPAFAFEATVERFKPDQAWRSAPARLAVFTSPRAVTFGLPENAVEQLAGARVAAIGPATAKALAARGLDVVEPAGGYTSEAFLAQPDLAAGEPGERSGRAVIFAAPGGRQALRRGLAALGWQVHMLEVYRRVPLDPDPGVAGRVLEAPAPASLWTSGNALEHLLGALGEPARERILGALMVVISERLADLARGHGATRVVVAAGPDNGSLLACLLEHGE